MSSIVLVTGANGFLGRAIQKAIPGHWRQLKFLNPRSIVSHDDDCCFNDIEMLPLKDGERPDVILHLAAKIPYTLDVSLDDLMQVNVRLVERLVKKYPDARHILASSVSVFGNPESLPLNVNSPTLGVTPYALSKLAAEKVISECGSYAIIRFSSLIGSDMYGGTFVPHVVAAAHSGEITIYGDGSRLQNYISVVDAANMCVRAMSSKDNFFTLGVSQYSHTNIEVANIVAAITGAHIKYVEGEQGPSFVYEVGDARYLGPCEYTIEQVLNGILVK